MRGPQAFVIAVALLSAAAGCRNCDHVEAELRSREREVQELRDELHRFEALNHCLQREVRDLHQPRPAPSSPSLPDKPSAGANGPANKVAYPVSAPAYGVTAVVLGRQTGGSDEDRHPGDEGLQVVVEPRDPDGHSIKAPGTLQVAALQVTPEGLKQPLCSWDVGDDQLRRCWRNGLLSTGYYVVLPWKVPPSSTRIRVVARLRLSDGRTFEADRDITIRLPPTGLRKSDEPILIETPVPLVEPVLPERSHRSTPAATLVRATAFWRGAEAGSAQLQRPVPLVAPWSPAGRLHGIQTILVIYPHPSPVLR